jgi:hypothetical protein
MRLSLLILAALVVHLPRSSAAAAPERLVEERVLPILAWIGPPAEQANVERYRELAECGFTHNFTGFPSADAMARALDVAQETGVKVFVSCPELQSDPEGTAKRFRNHPALAGYHLRDEPSAALFPELAAWVKRIRSVDAEHPCYINLFPNYADPAQLGTPTYREHVDQFIRQVPVQFVSFDHYPVVGRSLRDGFYENLEIVAAASRDAGKPFWAFSLAVAHGPYPVATTAHIRLQMYSNLAYGAQGLQYFTYWTVPSDTWNFHEAPILPDGRRGAVYARVQEVNRELQARRGVFLGSTVESVGHTGANIPHGTRPYHAAPPVQSLKTEGQGAAVSILCKGDRRFLVAVNRDINAAMKLDVQLQDDAGVRIVKKDGTLGDALGNAYRADVDPGDVVVLTWQPQGRPICLSPHTP